MKSFLIAAAAIATLASVPASAKDHSWPVGNHQYHVYYTDLDMTSTAGRAVMLVRVERAAAKLCEDIIGTQRAACVADTVAQATKARGGAMLKLALRERVGIAYAAR